MYPNFPSHYAGVPPPPPGNHKRLPGNVLPTSISSAPSTYRAGFDSRSGFNKHKQEQRHEQDIHQSILHQDNVVHPKGILRSPRRSTSKSKKQNRVQFTEPISVPDAEFLKNSPRHYMVSGKQNFQSIPDHKSMRSTYRSRSIVSPERTTSTFHHPTTNYVLEQSKFYKGKYWKNNSHSLAMPSRQSSHHNLIRHNSSSPRRRFRKH